MSIFIHSENISFQLPKEKQVKALIKCIIQENHLVPENVNIVITDDETLVKINKEYRNKDYYTDVISFVYNCVDRLEGDVFISINTVNDNALSFGCSVFDELLRVIIHGVLHLVGYEDDSDQKKEIMHKLEDKYLTVFENY